MKTLLTILSAVLSAGIVIAVIWRFLENCGLKLSQKLIAKLPEKFGERLVPKLTPAVAYSGVKHTPGNAECARVYLYTILFRIFVVLAGFVIYCLFIGDGSTVTLKEMIDKWVQWDARHYLNVAKGYTAYMEDGYYTTLVFFPLFPWLVRIMNLIIPNENVSAILVSSLCYSGGAVYMYKLACMDYSKSAAQRSVILFSIFPFAFYYGGIMSEGVFFLTTAMTFYYIRKHNWLMVGIAGFLCALSRSAGVFMIFPATIEFAEEYRIFSGERKFGEVVKLIASKWIWLLLMPIGTCIYLLINYVVSGNAFEFITLEGKFWSQSSMFFTKTIGSLWGYLVGGHSISTKMSIFVPGLILIFALLAVIIAGLRKHRTMYTAWLMIYLIFNLSISWPISICRYIASAIPAFFIVADYCERNKKLDTAVIMSFGIMFGIYMTGYLMTKQIM